MKRLSAALLLSTAFLAGSAQAQWEGNWLLGVSAGGAWHDGHDDHTLTISQGGTSVVFHPNHDNNDDHFIWGFLGGYQARCCNWLVGLELNVDWRGNDDDVNFAVPANALFDSVTGNISHDRDGVWGLTGRFGYFFNACIMPYIRLGVDYGNKDFDFTITTTDGGVVQSAFSDDDSNGKWGFVGGVGLEWFLPMICGVSLRAEWDYHSRNHHHDNIAALASDGITLFTFSGNGNRENHEQTARASLVYNFPI